jgi:hypothetical protein
LGIRKAPSHNRPRAGTEAEQHEAMQEARRAARFREEDERYRRALGLCKGERIPARIGQCQRVGARRPGQAALVAHTLGDDMV